MLIYFAGPLSNQAERALNALDHLVNNEADLFTALELYQKGVE